MVNRVQYRGHYESKNRSIGLCVDVSRDDSVVLKRYFGEKVGSGGPKIRLNWKFKGGKVIHMERHSYQNGMDEEFFWKRGELGDCIPFSHLPKDVNCVEEEFDELEDIRGKYVRLLRIGHETSVELLIAKSRSSLYSSNPENLKNYERGLEEIATDNSTLDLIEEISKNRPKLRVIHNYKNSGVFKMIYESMP